MSKRHWLGILACAALAVTLAAGSYSCSKSKSGGPAAPPAAKELDSGDLAPGGTIYSHTFMAAGTFGYHCIHHSVMTGTVTVTAGAVGADENISITTTAAFPSKNITVGTKVIWTNNSGLTHTVTSN